MRVAVLACCFLLCAYLTEAQNTSLRWYSFSSGFGTSLSPSGRATSSVGQPFVGTSQGASSIVVSGFLADTLLRGRIVSVKVPGGLPATFELYQNYPNPFSARGRSASGGNPSTNIKYQIPSSNHVTLKVFDVLGREVVTLVNENLQAGSYQVTFNAMGLASGVYLYRLQAGTFTSTRKLILLR